MSKLERLIIDHREKFIAAIDADFGGRSNIETMSAELLLVVDGVRHAQKHLTKWMARRPAGVNPLFLPSRGWVDPVPVGVVGIIAPWNYPLNLALAPAVAAFAAGNRVIIKPSELTPATSRALAEAVHARFTPDEAVVVEGDASVARAVTKLPLDHLIFTGSTQVGKLVAAAAAENLVPVTLELGGKSPALVHPRFSIQAAAERIAMGKLFNGGQTCIAPDYAVVEKSKARAFADAVIAQMEKQYPNLTGLTSMCTEKGFARMQALVKDAKDRGATVLEPKGTPNGRVMKPVVLLDVPADALVMQEEIFGPLLPIETYDSFDAALERINSRPRPLAFYYFDDDDSRADDVLRRVPCGGACVNDALMHFAQEDLPFGGLGASGLGAYHGEEGFRRFSHHRSVLSASRFSIARRFMTPPVKSVIARTLDLLIRGLKP